MVNAFGAQTHAGGGGGSLKKEEMDGTMSDFDDKRGEKYKREKYKQTLTSVTRFLVCFLVRLVAFFDIAVQSRMVTMQCNAKFRGRLWLL